MSNYIFIFSSPQSELQTQRWVERFSHEEANEVAIRNLSESTTLRIISAGLKQCLVDSAYFRGTAVDYNRHSIMFGAKGYAESLHDDRKVVSEGVEGEYLLARWSPTQTLFRRDAFGNAPILYYNGGQFAIISDSLLVISDYLKHMGHAPSVNEDALLSRMILNDVAGQQVGLDTLVTGVHYLPPPLSLSCHYDGGGFELKAGKEPRQVVFARGADVYRDGIRNAAESMAGLMMTLPGATDRRLTLSLSGGYDSRAILNAALVSGSELEYHFHTSRASERQGADYLVVSSLLAELNIVSNAPPSHRLRPAPQAASHTPMALWAASRLGLYDYLRGRHALPPLNVPVGLTGLGAETVKGNYGWKSWSELTSTFTSDTEARNALYTQGAAALDLIGVDPEEPGSAEWHYLAFRNALHTSAHLPLHMTGFAPLQQRALVGLARSELNEYPQPRYAGPSIVTDILIVLHAASAALPYVGEGKELTNGYVQDRLRTLGGSVRREGLRALRVSGKAEDVPTGPSKFAIKLAKLRNLNEPLTTETILHLGNIGLQHMRGVSDSDSYERVYNNARWRLLSKERPLSASGSSPAKLASVAALFADIRN